MSDGLTAEQAAEVRYPPMWNWAGSQLRSSHVRRKAFVEGAKWATEREKARAEAAEATRDTYLWQLEQRDTLLGSLHHWFYVQGRTDKVAEIAEVLASTIAAPTTEEVGSKTRCECSTLNGEPVLCYWHRTATTEAVTE